MNTVKSHLSRMIIISVYTITFIQFNFSIKLTNQLIEFKRLNEISSVYIFF
jgi:hypothetical protein